MKKTIVVLMVVAVTGAGYYFWRRGSLPFGSEKVSKQEREIAEREQRLERTLRAVTEAQRTGTIYRPGQPSAGTNPAGDAQRSLKTIEDINRMNRMNQELRQQNQGPSTTRQ